MYKRSDRLRELFLGEINASLREVHDPGLSGFLTITDLSLSPDAKSARVYYSFLGSAEGRAGVQRALERAAAFIRQRLYRRLRLKFIPKLEFRFDDTPEQAHRIETLLNRIREDAPPPERGEAEAESRHLGELGEESAEKRPPRFRRGGARGGRSRRRE